MLLLMKRQLQCQKDLHMPDVLLQHLPEATTADRTALRLMLEYVEGECRRLGATAAAEHAAKAAASITDADRPPAPPALPPLH